MRTYVTHQVDVPKGFLSYGKHAYFKFVKRRDAMLFLGGALRKCCRSGTCPMLQIDALEHSGILFAESALAFYLRQAGSEVR